MKKLLFLVLLISLDSFSQDLERVDAVIQLYPETFESAEQFSKFLSRDFTSDSEKVRAIYGWLIQNVAYEPEEYKKYDYTFKNYRERNQKEEKIRAKIINRTLQTGKAVCEGYAFVFEKLCNMQGIENYLVRGDTKTQIKDIGRSFNKNHMWNAVKLEGTWSLFDATWGAGKYRVKFIKEPSYFYYAIAPEQLIKTHFPEMVEDSFLKTPIMFSEFTKRPIIISPEILPEDILSPAKGIVFSNSSQNEVYFEIQTAAPKEIQYAYGASKKSVLFSEKEGVLHFAVPIQLGSDTLIIYFDEKPVLAYKVI
ncbi:MAG: hypothetical protein CL596_10910 [Alteromonas sp.]|nr:hypothetical protein [Alteromonas sp.]MAY21337.1 hypothetical protein [Flavobacteriaceae bacterium]|tara:strand:- start:208 stop:1134 length:927 start_codon:yes stop_codon:yes gene_type:complete